MRYRGVVVIWFARGFGFVAIGRQQYYMHISQTNGVIPRQGDVFEFELAPSLKEGKPPRAINAVLVEAAEGGAK